MSWSKWNKTAIDDDAFVAMLILLFLTGLGIGMIL